MEVYIRLLESGCDVYVPAMYIRHDCVVKTPSGKHLDVEIRSREPGRRNFSLAGVSRRDNMYAVLHYGYNDDYVLPAKVALDHSNAKKGRRISMSQKKKDLFRDYHNNYDSIRNA